MNKLICNFAVTLLTIAIACICAQAQTLSPEEQKIASYIDAHQAEQIALLTRVVNLQSPTENIAGVKQVGMVFKSQLESLGMTARWIDMPAEMKRAGHLLAQTKGTKGKRVLLLGHIDTVLSGEKFKREGNRALGTGTVDMKAGDIVMLYALKALDSAGLLKDRRIVVMLTGDEENAGRPLEISRGDMVAAAKNADLALSFEAAAGNRATVGRRGSSNWALEVTGQTGHSAGIFRNDAGAGAIFETARILDQFYESLHKEKNLTFNPSVIVGGTQAALNGTDGIASGKTNVIPAKVLVSGDLRFLSEQQKEAARAKMRDIVVRSLPRTSAKITFEDRYPAMTPNDGNYQLLKQLDQVSQDLGAGKMEALDPAERGAGDIAFVSHLIPGLDGIGASGGGAHAPGEFVELDSLPLLTKRAALLIYRLTR
ncbi:MAG TPA: M20/M25/M40 family metallo-hydrolase [Pyrinomonadaceae bacterium]|nr:M20/M25/M40 family metallo-hydrolase [Pyrinomonadaceae bacterium]